MADLVFASLIAWSRSIGLTPGESARRLLPPAEDLKPLSLSQGGFDLAVPSVVGIEFHHDHSGRVDASAYADTSLLCPPVVGRFARTGYIELDALPDCSRAQISGFWLHLQRTDLPWRDFRDAVTAQTELLGFTPDISPVRLAYERLTGGGLVGLMPGRGPALRISRPLRGATREAIAASVFAVDEACPGTLPLSAEQLVSLLCDEMEGVAFSLCLDFGPDGLLPVIGVEFLDIHRGVSPRLVEALVSRWGIPQAQIDGANAIAARLPIIDTPDLHQQDFGRYFDDPGAWRTFSATLSHLKLTFRPSGENTLKTYIRLMLEPPDEPESTFYGPQPPASAAGIPDSRREPTGQPEGDSGLP